MSDDSTEAAPRLCDIPLRPISGANSLAEKEVADGVFLIYDNTLPARRQLIGSVSSQPDGWAYWSKDSDCQQRQPSKLVAITAMREAIELRRKTIEAFDLGYRYRIHNPIGVDYAVSLESAKLSRVGDALILEFNKYGGSYRVE